MYIYVYICIHILRPQKYGSVFWLAVTNMTFASLGNFESPSTPLTKSYRPSRMKNTTWLQKTTPGFFDVDALSSWKDIFLHSLNWFKVTVFRQQNWLFLWNQPSDASPPSSIRCRHSNFILARISSFGLISNDSWKNGRFGAGNCGKIEAVITEDIIYNVVIWNE